MKAILALAVALGIFYGGYVVGEGSVDPPPQKWVAKKVFKVVDKETGELIPSAYCNKTGNPESFTVSKLNGTLYVFGLAHKPFEVIISEDDYESQSFTLTPEKYSQSSGIPVVTKVELQRRSGQ